MSEPITIKQANKIERMVWKRPDKPETGCWEGQIGKQRMILTRELAQKLGIEEALDTLLAHFADQQGFDQVTLLEVQVQGLTIKPMQWMLLPKREDRQQKRERVLCAAPSFISYGQ